jgi:transposase
LGHSRLHESFLSPRRFNRWRKAGIWDRLMDAIIAAHDGKVQMVDSTIVRVHQQAVAPKNKLETLASVEVVEG